MAIVNLSDMQETGQVRQPRAWVNGINVIELRVEQVVGQPSMFGAKIAADDPSGPGMSFWANLSGPTGATVTATNGDGSGSTATLFVGKIYEVEIDWENRIAILTGKDGMQDMLNTRDDASYPNMPTTAIVAQMAGKGGLGLMTNGGGQMAGRTYDNQNYCYNSDEQNCLDVVQDMANQDGNYFFAHNNILYYAQPGGSLGGVYEIFYTPPSSVTYETSNAVHLVTKHDLHLAQGVGAGVGSWFPYNKEANVGGETGAKNFYKRSPGLTMNQAMKEAQNLNSFANNQELTIEAWMPGDVVVNPTMSVVLSGTGSVFDTNYNIMHVSHEFNFDGGYMMMIQGQAPGGGAGGGESTFATIDTNNPNEPTFATTSSTDSTEATFANTNNPNEPSFATINNSASAFDTGTGSTFTPGETPSPDTITVTPSEPTASEPPKIVSGPAPPSAFGN